MPLMLSGAEPLFVSEADWAGLVVPVVCDSKVRLAGLRLTAGAADAAEKRVRMFAVIFCPALLATEWSQLQKPSLKPLSTPNAHWIVPAEKTVAPLPAV